MGLLIPKIPAVGPPTRKFGKSHNFFSAVNTFPSSKTGISRFLPLGDSRQACDKNTDMTYSVVHVR